MTQNKSLLVGIVADDLTSATDGAAPFLAKRYAPLIARDPEGLEERAVVSIDTNSRASPLAHAAEATATAVSALSHASLLFKTIDSTLRGHIRPEIAAAFRASARPRLIVAPAFPDAGRLTVNGIQRVNGIPVSESVYARDPVHPAGTSQVADLIDPSLGRVLILGHDRAADAADSPILILDADSQDALNRQVARIPDPQTVLWVGSPGLAIALAALISKAPYEHQRASATPSRVLIVAGSTNPVTHAQCDSLRAHGVPIVTDTAEAPADARVLCLRAPVQRQDNAKALVATLAAQAATALARQHYDAVIATGGETMANILDRLHISRFVLTHELEPGFPVGRAEQAGGAPLVFAMKAGGFGSPSTLLHAARALSGAALLRKPPVDDLT